MRAGCGGTHVRGGMSLVALVVWTGCVLDLPSVLEPDGCDGPPVPCGTQCIAPDEVCEPRDFAGTYAVSLRAGVNQCQLENWEEGTTAEAPITITQEGDAIAVQIDGIAGLLLSLGFGAEPVFIGTVEGDVLEARLAATRQATEGGCAWRFAPVIRAQATGTSSIEGRLEYRIESNGHPDCPDFFADCASVQSFVASRPPDP